MIYIFRDTVVPALKQYEAHDQIDAAYQLLTSQ